MSTTQERRARYAVQHYGTTYAEAAGITLRDKPAPLYRLLVLATLLSARISADTAVAAARELHRAGYRTPQRMADATWQQRVDALGRGSYRRYDERTATMLGEGAELLLADYRGDLRQLRPAGPEDAVELRSALQKFPGIGPTGVDIFCREVQAVWPGLVPSLDRKALQGAARAGLPEGPQALARLVPERDVARLAAASVRAALDGEVAAAIEGA
ncbi:MAG TPA: endonuclease [Candidatus Ruania gallistercoris]|uniref:Endonuclease n=1 Tax=Candidatus Ruania gallistercoris TaxID=2838746 RepID=A0A9D2ECH0_9MICO|nr:endonuclease [Candidatus Ruania gallistercoris]